jgi:hypothetical protein
VEAQTDETKDTAPRAYEFYDVWKTGERKKGKKRRKGIPVEERRKIRDSQYRSSLL